MGAGQSKQKAEEERRRKELLRPRNALRELKAPQDRPADFGSIRFPGSRKPVSKWARISSAYGENQEKIEPVIPLLTDSWTLKPPSAIISIPSVRGHGPDEILTNKGQLVFQRGLVNAARTTNAWVVTGGLSQSVAALVGRAFAESELPLIGIVPWNAVSEHRQLEERPNGSLHQYGDGPGVSHGADGAVDPALGPQYKLDPYHSHFLMVDDGRPGVGGERKLRGELERYLCDKDVSGDGIRTPMVVLMINGDAETLQWVKDALDDQDPTTGWVLRPPPRTALLPPAPARPTRVRAPAAAARRGRWW